jgi:hypothetical protein
LGVTRVLLRAIPFDVFGMGRSIRLPVFGVIGGPGALGLRLVLAVVGIFLPAQLLPMAASLTLTGD